MQTNGTGGGNRHEAPEKHQAPGTFPCQPDMELCTRGARRRVDQHGTSATPWQFVNLGHMGKSEELEDTGGSSNQ